MAGGNAAGRRKSRGMRFGWLGQDGQGVGTEQRTVPQGIGQVHLQLLGPKVVQLASKPAADDLAGKTVA